MVRARAAVRALLVLAALLPVSSAVGAQTVERQARIALASGATCDLTIQLQPDHVSQAARIEDAATEALNQYSEWLSPFPGNRLTIVDVRWDAPEPAAQPGVVVVRARWLQPERALTLEAQVARGIARQWWGGLVHVEDRFLADGLAEYLQGRTVERIFDRRHQRTNYSLAELRVFGGLVPWAIRALRLDRETTGIGRAVYRRQPDIDLRDPADSARPAQMAKTAAALTTLERYLGWPVLQRGLQGAVRRYAGGSMSTRDFASTLGDAADRDLSWFFDEAFGKRTTYDYAVDELSSVEEAGAYRTTVVVARHGDALFTGTSQTPVGAFESGRALEIHVDFADGQTSVEHWDGRAPTKTLVFHGPAPATAARINPGRILLLDLHAINNSRTRVPAPAVASLPWSVRWTTWLQDALLSSAFFF